jgi:hypothetical protein
MDEKVKSGAHRQPGEHERDTGPNQGEGDYRSARAYDEHVRRSAQSGQTEKKAREAEKALAGKEGEELRHAEELGKRHSHGEDPQLHKKK